MTASGEVTQENDWGPIQGFIFKRELAEVYLLLDHLSGRSDKSLAAIGDKHFVGRVYSDKEPVAKAYLELARETFREK
jgi:hypothetical protein